MSKSTRAAPQKSSKKPNGARPSFTTKRLNVFKVTVQPTAQHQARAVFIGFRTDIDFPAAIITATVWVDSPLCGPYVEWIETNDRERRQGFASELWRGIEKHLGEELQAEGATEAGNGFVAAMVTDAVV